MRNLLELVFEYRRLRAHSRAVAGELRPAAQERLEALERLFGRDPEESRGERRHARCAAPCSATIRTRERVQPVQIINLSGGGVCVSPAPLLHPGEIAMLRVASEDDPSRIFQSEVRESWSQRKGADSRMGMPFVGTPRELSVSDEGH